MKEPADRKNFDWLHSDPQALGRALEEARRFEDPVEREILWFVQDIRDATKANWWAIVDDAPVSVPSLRLASAFRTKEAAHHATRTLRDHIVHVVSLSAEMSFWGSRIHS